VTRQAVNLIAQGLTFISFAVAILFAFFKRTEPIAHAVIDQWFSLLVQTIAVAVLQGMVVALYLSAAQTTSPLLVMAVSIVCLVFMVMLLLSGMKAVWGAFNRLFVALGQSTSGAMMTPAQGAVVAGGGVMGLTSGSAALAAGTLALATGHTVGQSAGITFGGSRVLDSAAFALSHLPGLRNTNIGNFANGYIEGSAVQRFGSALLGPVGTLASIGLLSGEPSPPAAAVSRTRRSDTQGSDAAGEPSGAAQGVRMTTSLTPTVDNGQRYTVSGIENVAHVLAQSIDRLPRQSTTGTVQNTAPLNLTAAVAEAMNAPAGVRLNGSPVRYRMFAGQAISMGLSGAVAGDALQDVKRNPQGSFSPAMQTQLSAHGSEEQIARLQHLARLVPNSISLRSSSLDKAEVS